MYVFAPLMMDTATRKKAFRKWSRLSTWKVKKREVLWVYQSRGEHSTLEAFQR